MSSDNPSNAVENHSDIYGNGSCFIPLLTTQQSYTHIDDGNGNRYSVFDHPYSKDNRRITNQGSAFPDDGSGNGITGTCGLCAVATIINKAGGNTSEKSVTEYALNNNLCYSEKYVKSSNRGGTNDKMRVQLLADAGIPSSFYSDKDLQNISTDVDNGKGVIISVVASLYKPEWYGKFSTVNAGNHAIVLESPVRDDEGKITGYLVSDSNGRTSEEACVYADADTLEHAFRMAGSRCVITDEVIW